MLHANAEIKQPKPREIRASNKPGTNAKARPDFNAQRALLGIIKTWQKRAAYLQKAVLRMAMAFYGQDPKLDREIDQLQRSLTDRKRQFIDVKQLGEIVKCLIRLGKSLPIKDTIGRYQKAADSGDRAAASRLASLQRLAQTTQIPTAKFTYIECPHCGQTLRLPNPPPTMFGRCKTCKNGLEITPDAYGNLRIYALNAKREHTERSETLTVQRCFEVLGIKPNSSPGLIKATYKRRMTEYHPDKVVSLGKKIQETAEKESRLINEAYTMLKEHGIA